MMPMICRHGLEETRCGHCCKDEPSAEIDARTMNDAVVQVSRMISGTYSPSLDAEAHLWRRVMKVAEETGEVTEALLGLLGENPRKGRTHTPADLRKELFDVALAALGAAAYLDGNTTDVEAMFRQHAIRVRDRLADALDPHLERADSPSCRALDGCPTPPGERRA